MYQTIRRIYLSKPHLSFILLVLGYLFLATGCNTRVEGCLDVAAANFDLNADRACQDCCTYPVISISLSQKWNDRNFSTADTLLDSNGKLYRINDLKYFLSSWSWIDSGNITYTVDSAEIACNDHILRYTPDIILVDSRQFLYALGTIHKSPTMDSIQLKLGLLPALDCIDEIDSNTPSILSDKSALWNHQLSSRAALRIVLQRDITMETFDTVFIHACENINLGYDLDLKPGIATTLNLSVNYALWFSHVDIQNLNSFETSILTGIPGSLFKTP